ncbi:MAG: glycosyltransferase family 4 protein [Bdellovibrionales bacterium]|nr:glycosyltransferase family 4 protein [Bdellovibrionales bacterium]
MALRVLLVFDQLDLPEAQVFRRIAGKQIQLDVLCNTDGLHHKLFEGCPISVEPLRCAHRLDVTAIRTVRRKLKAERYDIVHVFTSRTLSVVLLALLGLPYTPKVVAYRGALGNVSRFDLTSQLTFRNKRVDRIVCVSDAVKHYLRSTGIPESKLIRIYKGHELGWYSGAPRAALQEFGVPDNAFVVACVANMRPNKGVDVLLAAAEELRDEPKLHYLLIGDVRDKRLLEIAEKLSVRDRLHFTGWRADAAKLIGPCDVLALPTRYSEGLPKAVIEAMAQGVPPVASRVGGVPELVTDGVDGLVVTPGDSKALARGILKLYRDPSLRRRFGTAAKQKIETQFHVLQTVQQTVELYCDLAGEEVSVSETIGLAGVR